MEGITAISGLSGVSVREQPDGPGKGDFSSIADGAPIHYPRGKTVRFRMVAREVDDAALEDCNGGQERYNGCQGNYQHAS